MADGGGVPSGDLFAALLNTSDFFGDPDRCRAELEAVRKKAWGAQRTSFCETAPVSAAERPPVRLSCCGVPTILSDMWDVFERAGARFVDHEVPRQFALFGGIGKGMLDTYLQYTYPYDVFDRIRDVTAEGEARGVAGLVHYVQSFCHRQIEDRLWRERVKWPILTLEADRPGRVDERTRTRIEAFVERFVM